MAEALIGVIGGTGLYQIEGLTDTKETIIDTPFGAPSDAIVTGVLNGVGVAFLPRHGRGHRLMPSEIPSRANIYALKSLGVERVISVSAVGSLRENIRPLDMIVPDQLIDRTVGRPSTFFGDGLIAHVGMADPFCPEMRDILYNSASEMGARAHPSGTLVIINGPQFSTRAESHMYRSWGADIIGMTAPAGGQTRQGSGDVLLYTRLFDRLRLLVRERGTGDGGDGGGEPDAEHGSLQGNSCGCDHKSGSGPRIAPAAPLWRTLS